MQLLISDCIIFYLNFQLLDRRKVFKQIKDMVQAFHLSIPAISLQAPLAVQQTLDKALLGLDHQQATPG